MKIITVTPNPALDITAHVDGWQRGVLNRGQSLVVNAGGKGINVAINLAHSGLEVHATGWLGRDNDSAFSQTFSHERINDAFIRIDGETRQNLKIVDSRLGENTDFNMPGTAVNATAIQALDDYLSAQVDEWTVVAFGGSLPPGVPLDYYAKMVKRFRDKCHFLAVDVGGRALSEVLQADWLPDMVKPNIHELRDVTGKALTTDAEIVAEAQAWIARGIKMFIVSLGRQGAWFVTQEAALKALPLQVNAATTVGAGDAMVAGALRGIVIGRDLADIAKSATAYSAANIEHVGAGLPSQPRLESLKSQVIIEHWAV